MIEDSRSDFFTEIATYICPACGVETKILFAEAMGKQSVCLACLEALRRLRRLEWLRKQSYEPLNSGELLLIVGVPPEREKKL